LPDNLFDAWQAAPHSVQANFFEFCIREAIFRFALPGSTAIDAGADGGAHTIHMAAAVGPKGKVLSIEPNPNRAEFIRSRYPLANIEVIEIALSDHHGIEPFYVATSTGLSSLKIRARADFQVDHEIIQRVTRLDDLEQLQGCPPVSLIKADLEGEELAFLRGATSTLTRDPLLILIEIDWWPSFDVDRDNSSAHQQAALDFLAWLQTLGYTALDFFGRPVTQFEPSAWNVALVPGRMSVEKIAEFFDETSRRYFSEFRDFELYP